MIVTNVPNEEHRARNTKMNIALNFIVTVLVIVVIGLFDLIF
jgi:hypothetical protein